MSRHAYLILAHSDVPLFTTLVALLDDSRNDIFIHIDRSVDSRPFEDAVHHTVTASEVRFTSHRHRVVWGGFSMVEAELALLEMAVEEQPYDYIHLLSGVDLPLMCPDDIHSYFDQRQGTEFVDFWDINEQLRPEIQARYQYFDWFQPRARNHFARLAYHAVRAFSLGIQRAFRIDREAGYTHHPSVGSQMFSITSDLARLVVSCGPDIRARFHHTLVPDEAVIQTVVQESPFANRLSAPPGSGPNKTIARAIKMPKPHIWHLADVDYLVTSGAVFARKFASSVDSEAIRSVAAAVRRAQSGNTDAHED
ncbi:MAG: beta-1,6-N-acetylglucosaminyltransferase [Propionibacteriaceae bacterium]|jgi:hypothetical protein|nr:beta-1,6-N-acetylglucosaminyltransferase [Propionibacteriaceae bacterium]